MKIWVLVKESALYGSEIAGLFQSVEQAKSWTTPADLEWHHEPGGRWTAEYEWPDDEDEGTYWAEEHDFNP